MQKRRTYVLTPSAAIRGGLELDILQDMYWRRTTDIVENPVLAATAYVMACAHRRGQPIQQFMMIFRSRWSDSRKATRRGETGARPDG